MSKFRITSDWHTEILETYPAKALRILQRYILPKMPDEHEQTLILAGDIGNFKQRDVLAAVLEDVSERFAKVYYIPGNHEYYGDSIAETVRNIDRILPQNVEFGEVVLADGIAGATLWTDFDKENNDAMGAAQVRMNDYRRITFDKMRALSALDILDIHKNHRDFLDRNIKAGDLVFTHHAPSWSSIDPLYVGDEMNPAYVSDLDALIIEKRPKFWVHGHTHSAHDYMIGETRIICNPYGYHGYGKPLKNEQYNPMLVVED